MKFRKLVMAILLSVVILNFSAIEVYAAEGTGESQINNTEAVTTDNQDVTIANQSVTADSQEVTTANQSVTADGQEVTSANQSVTADTQEVATENQSLTVGDQEDAAEVEDKTEYVTVEETTEVKETKAVKETKVAKKTVKVKYTKAELRLLSALIYCEAQSESYNGKLAVAIVVMNRVRSNLFPDTVKGVIYQRYQFSPVTNGTLRRALAEYDNGRFNSAYEKACVKAAKAALSGEKSITVKGNEKKFSKYLFFSCWLKGHTFELGNHDFK